MLGSTDIVAFVAITNAEKARAFYERILGLRFIKDDGFALVFEANGIIIRAAKMKEFTPAQFTVLGWQVSQIEETVQALSKKGVKFEIFRILQAGRAGHLDRPHRRQSGMVQGSRWKYPLGFRARLTRSITTKKGCPISGRFCQKWDFTARKEIPTSPKSQEKWGTITQFLKSLNYSIAQ
jgi:hypothetical protein